MRQSTFLPIVILTLNAGSEEHERGILRANGFNAIKPLEGVYRGEEGRGWLVCISGRDDRIKLLNLAENYDQESVLFSSTDRTCHLHAIKNGHAVYVGVLTEVSCDFAIKQESYTFDPHSGKYWVCL